MLTKNPMRNADYLRGYSYGKQLYLQEEYSLTKAAQIAKLDRGTFSANLKTEGFEIVNKQNETKFNPNVFKTVSTEEQAYWLGFLYADGYVAKDSNIIELSLKTSDKKHLEKFRDFLGFRSTKHIFQDAVRCRLSFANKELKEDLMKLGCSPQKSLTLTFPPQDIVPPQFQLDFIRGYVDGDGSVMLNAKRDAGRLSILGTYSFLKSLIKVTGWRKASIWRVKQEKVFCVEWSGKYVTSYLMQLYENANIYLDRKYEKYLAIKSL